ncbi:Na+/H+ antiporter NhaA [Pedobacter sp. SL55]|uniref:Na+/H+ antiporter NhaA n=1 Tax=Pedobacter sp. SL55 TaxID=2995161 RepID=UPI00226E05F2|nr:Na+/H+ antiporter NhaA [Pedobacter sp. SL55]WAC39543.1 Na+/H+ antiporter NhaA [Pedobacter sp. SL55]
MQTIKKTPIEKISKPIQSFIAQEKSGGIVLGISVILALILANSGWSASYHHFLENSFGFQWNGKSCFDFSLHHWINDGLMAVFFFVVGLELKREIVGCASLNFVPIKNRIYWHNLYSIGVLFLSALCGLL